MASEKLKMAKSDSSELGLKTIDMLDGIVMAKNSDGSKNITGAKPEAEFLYMDEEENGDSFLPDLDSVDSIGLEEEEEEVESNRRPTRLKTKSKNFRTDFVWMSDDSDTGDFSFGDSSDEYQLNDSSDNDDDYMIEGPIGGKRVLGSKQSSVATKKLKTTANNTKHTTGWFDSTHSLLYIRNI